MGSLWNNVTQLDAAKISRNMYNNDNSVGVESDLINSYAWDTAIVFIQEMENTNYANKTSTNNSLTNTGTTGDEVCNIHDMASNCFEWTTEYSDLKLSDYVYPCTYRGVGVENSSTSEATTAWRAGERVDVYRKFTGFRIVIYIK